MGRHSAPDDPDDAAVDEAAGAAGTTALATIPAGRHATEQERIAAAQAAADLAAPQTEPAPDAEPTPEVEPAPDVEPALDVEPAPDSAEPTDAVPAKRAPRDGGTHADLRLLREQPGLRARCVAAVLIPFVLYTVVLVVLSSIGVFLFWVWIPTVTAGVGVGALLDGAHKRKSAD